MLTPSGQLNTFSISQHADTQEVPQISKSAGERVNGGWGVRGRYGILRNKNTDNANAPTVTHEWVCNGSRGGHHNSTRDGEGGRQLAANGKTQTAKRARVLALVATAKGETENNTRGLGRGGEKGTDHKREWNGVGYREAAAAGRRTHALRQWRGAMPFAATACAQHSAHGSIAASSNRIGN